MTQSRSNFVIFLLVAFGITIPLFYYSTIQSSPGVVLAALLMGSYAPALGAWIATARDGEEAKRAFRRRLWGWGGPGWVGVALLAPSVIWILVFGISFLQNPVMQPAWAALAALPMILLVNYGEEIGWRGYALPYLMQRFNPFVASLVLGMIWALFHAALYWQRPIFGLMASGIVMAMSVILAWMFVNTGKILPGTLFHAVFNAWTQVFITAESETALGIAMALSVLLAGYLLIRYHQGLTIQS